MYGEQAERTKLDEPHMFAPYSDYNAALEYHQRPRVTERYEKICVEFSFGKYTVYHSGTQTETLTHLHAKSTSMCTPHKSFIVLRERRGCQQFTISSEFMSRENGLYGLVVRKATNKTRERFF